MASSTSLTDAYRNCIDWFFNAAQNFENDGTGRIEKITLDGIFLIFWAQLVGLDNGNLDPQLGRFQAHIELQLLQLLSSFERSTQSTIRYSEDARSLESNILSGWIVDASKSTGRKPVPARAKMDDNGESQPVLRQDALQELSATAEDVRKALARLLSRHQREILEKNMSLWKNKRLNNDGPGSLEALLRASMDRDSELASMANARIHASGEDGRVDRRLLIKMAVKTEDLRWAIPRRETPEGFLTLSESHAVGKYQNKLVFVEKRRNLDWKAEGSNALEIFLRIDSLAAKLAKCPKPATFRTLDCLGYFSDRQDKEYAFVYTWPWEIGEWAERLKPKTLHELLGEKNNSVGPSLTIRFELAKRLAACVQTFHIFRWLHKSINSHNLLHFPNIEDEDPCRMTLPECTFLTGFEYSRQDGRNYVTEPVTTIGSNDIYRHPEVTSFERRLSPTPQASIFQKSHDLYALGLVLVEIGLWDTLERILADLYRENATFTDGMTFHAPAPSELYRWIVRGGNGSLEDLLLFSTGDRYTSATMACIRGDVGNGVEYVNDMYSKVIEPLNCCAA